MRKLIIATAVATLFAAPHVHADEAVAYTVVESDTIETIAGTYDITVEDIMLTNGLDTVEIEVGTILYIPPEHARGYYDPDTSTYLIAPGDDLYQVAKRFATTVEALQQANGLTSSDIEAGATLQIPN